jgi:hypothetical protein
MVLMIFALENFRRPHGGRTNKRADPQAHRNQECGFGWQHLLLSTYLELRFGLWIHQLVYRFYKSMVLAFQVSFQSRRLPLRYGLLQAGLNLNQRQLGCLL